MIILNALATSQVQDSIRYQLSPTCRVSQLLEKIKADYPNKIIQIYNDAKKPMKPATVIKEQELYYSMKSE